MKRSKLEPFRLLAQPVYLAVVLSHFAVDVLNSQTGILLAVLSTPLGLTNAAIGLVATVYTLAGGLTQPIFGWLTDRHGARWAAAGGVLWMAAFFSLVSVVPGYWPLICLVVGSLGSGAFHPSGTMKASQIGNRQFAGQMATAASVFFLFGQGGLALGPAMGGILIEHLGRGGILVLAGLAVPVGLFAARMLREPLPQPPAAGEPRAARPARAAWSPSFTLLALVLIIAGGRVWAQLAFTTFAPKFYHDLGWSPSAYGAAVALFMGSSAVGGVLGAMLSERWGERRTTVVTLALSALPFFFLPAASPAMVFVLATAAGLLNGAPHSILVALAQRLLPGRAATASGVILGFMFASGALGTYLSGIAADYAGLAPILQANAAISVACAAAALALRPQPAPAPAAQTGD